MKRIFVISIFLFSVAGYSQDLNVSASQALTATGQITKSGQWVQLHTVQFSSESYDKAQYNCNNTAKALQLMSNDKVLFQANCKLIGENCIYRYCFELSSKVIFIGND